MSKKSKKNWQVQWRLKRTPKQIREGAYSTRERAITDFKSLMEQGYRARLACLEYPFGPGLGFGFLNIMAKHRWPFYQKVKGEIVMVKEETFTDPEVAAELAA